MINLSDYLFVCLHVYACNRIICFENRIAGKSLRYETFAYYKDKTAAVMAAIAAEMLYDLR